MTTLSQASHQWRNRPADERFVTLHDLRARVAHERDHSRAPVVSSRAIEFRPDDESAQCNMKVYGPNGHGYEATHWSFGQLANLAGAPAGYLRSLPTPIAADCLNYGMRFDRNVQEIGCLLTLADGTPQLRAATGPNYGRIWNADIADTLIHRFGDGVTGDWRVPGEFGHAVTVTKANTTLYASDRDMFVFLADETRRIEIPNRRDGKAGGLARGFFVWNSEVGSKTLGAAFFLFDYVCCNRMIWGAEQFKEIRIRHTSGAPDRWLEEVHPVLTEYANASEKPVLQAIEDARARRLDDVDAFLLKRFSRKQAAAIQATHELEEGRPIENRWDAAVGVTAFARSVPYQDARVDLEREAGKLLAA